MGIEEDLENMFKHFGSSGKVFPVEMIGAMMKSMEINMLRAIRAQVDSRLGELSKSTDKSMDPFAILGVNLNSTKAEVEKAFRAKAWVAHPDRGGSNEKMAMVNAAREAIFRLKGWK